MARGVEDADHPPGKVELETVGGLDDALGGHRNQLAVELPGPLRPYTAETPANSLEGSTMCRAPRGCTTSFAFGKAA